jgi:TolB-like protein
MRGILSILIALFCLAPLSARAECQASRIEALCAGLAENLNANLQVRLDRTAPLVTAPFANLHDLASTSPLGTILAEEMGNAFARYGYAVTDPRAFAPSAFSRKEHGETALSANADLTGNQPGARHILTGTYALADGGVRVWARIVLTSDHSVLAAASCRLRLTAEVHGLMASTNPRAKTPQDQAALLNPKKKPDAKRIQQALAAQGLYTSKIDGVWGKKSKAALARFRASLALPATPTWDHAAQAALLPAP